MSKHDHNGVQAIIKSHLYFLKPVFSQIFKETKIGTIISRKWKKKSPEVAIKQKLRLKNEFPTL